MRSNIAFWSISLVLPLVLGLGSRTCAASSEGSYRVFLDRKDTGEFRKAAEEMAELRNGSVETIDLDNLAGWLESLRKSPPRFVVFVLPPEKIDVDLSHRILSLSTQVDEDPFLDFEYGFVTGKDGAAATRFVAAIRASLKKTYRRDAGGLGSWEGPTVPPPSPSTVAKAIGFEFEQHFVHVTEPEKARKQKARKVLRDLSDKDALVFFSHGYPDEMVACFHGRDLLDWNVRFDGSLLVNCCCYGGAPGRWYEPRPQGYIDRGWVEKEDSVALHLLDSGIASYFAGIDPWHGWLANVVYLKAVGEGLRLGEVVKNMGDRLALDFLPEKIHFPPAATMKFEGEGTANRRRNGAGMIFYGDPAHAPYGESSLGLGFATLERTEEGLRGTIGLKPLVAGMPGGDFLQAMCFLTDYYSVKTAAVMDEIKMEVYRVVDLPTGETNPPALRVVSARSGEMPIPVGPPQTVVEHGHDGPRLHIRIPILARPIGSQQAIQIAQNGIEIHLAENQGQ